MRLDGLTFDDVLLRPQKGIVESRKDVDVSVSRLGLKIPLIAAPMPSVSSYVLISELNRLGGSSVLNRMGVNLTSRLARYTYCPQNTWIAIGCNEEEFLEFLKAGATRFALDVAHGHSLKALKFIEWMRAQAVERYKVIAIMSGSIATAQAAYDNIGAGADVLRVGIGPGSACTTRQVTGFGVPQLEAIQQVYDEAIVPVVADGGIRNSGDIVKAIAAGADAVMIGRLFAHANEAPQGDKHHGCASAAVNGHRAPEGISLDIEEREPLEDIVKRLVWGIKSGVSYGGGNRLENLKHCEFVRLTEAGRSESKL